MPWPGEQLLELISGASKELLLVSPFIKVAALKRLIESVPQDVSLTVVTRWRLEEIAAGVSDLEVWPLIEARDGSALWLRSDLHAKYYRADDKALVGSANLTQAALGWSARPNLELLVNTEADRRFEEALFSGSVAVDQDLYTVMLQAAEKLEHRPMLGDFVSEIGIDDNTYVVPEAPPVRPDVWLPSLRHPEDLYKAYCGRWEELTTASREAAQKDLAFLAIAPGLGEREFERVVGTLLLQVPLIREIDLFVVEPQRFGAVEELISKRFNPDDPDFRPDHAWQTLMRWLLSYLPERYLYSQPHYSEVFSKRVEC